MNKFHCLDTGLSPEAVVPFVVPQIQVSLNCNLDCRYCFLDHNGRHMRPETAAVILNKLVETHRLSTGRDEWPRFLVYWHGGEPLLAGLPFFERVVEIESSFKGVVFENRIQTNGVLMTEAFAKFFVEHDFQVGFSLDGPRELHDRYRHFRGSQKGSFEAALIGINRYRRAAGIRQVPVIAVITKASIGRATEIFQFFKDLHARVQLDIFDLRCLDLAASGHQKAPAAELVPTPLEVGRYLIELFDLWFYDDTGRADFSELRHEVKSVLQPEINRGSPFNKKRCDFRRMIFDPQGRAYSCDQYINDEKTALGNIHHESLLELFQRKEALWERIKQHIRGSDADMACHTCEWGRKCGGGCLTCMKYNALLLEARSRGWPDSKWPDCDLPAHLKDMRGETYYCYGLKAFREHVKKAVAGELADACQSG